MIDFSQAVKEEVIVNGLTMIKFTSNQWIQSDQSSSPLNYNQLNLIIREVKCDLFIEKFSGTVTEINLQVSYDAQAGLIRNLPFLEYSYYQKLDNLEIFRHLYFNTKQKLQFK